MYELDLLAPAGKGHYAVHATRYFELVMVLLWGRMESFGTMG